MEEQKKREHNISHPYKSHSKKFNLYNIFLGLTVLLGVFLIFNLLLTLSLSKDLKKNTEIVKESSRPADVDVTLIRNSKCSDCFDVSPVIDYVRSTGVNIKSDKIIDFDSNEARELIKKYKIEKVPNAVITGEIEKANLEGFEKKEGALLLSAISAPYTNTSTGKIAGRVEMYNLKDTQCTLCSNLTLLSNQIKFSGIRITQEKNIEVNSSEGQDLIKKYKINFVPTIILSKDASVYDIMKQAWPRIGSIEDDGVYVLRSASPPYMNLTTNKLLGLVSIIYISDGSCTECYNVSLHKQILSSPQSFAMWLGKEETIDVSNTNGKELISKYNIKQVPTVILSGDIGVYASSQALKQFYTVEEDGSYVFRQLDVIGPYKDLATGVVVKPEQNNEE